MPVLVLGANRPKMRARNLPVGHIGKLVDSGQSAPTIVYRLSTDHMVIFKSNMAIHIDNAGGEYYDLGPLTIEIGE